MPLNVDILTPSESLFSGEASEVLIPGINGEAGILPQHAAYLTALGPGKLIVTSQGQTHPFSITGGLCQVVKDKIVVLVDGISPNAEAPSK